MINMKKILIAVLCLIVLSSCAHGVDVNACFGGNHVYGFWGGLWHGIIAPLDLFCMLFSDTIVVYAPNNNGGWYALGFCLGAGILFSSSTKATGSKK